MQADRNEDADRCAKPGCPAEATMHFGVETPPREDPRYIQAVVCGDGIVGRRWFPGDTIHVCREHAREVYDYGDRITFGRAGS